MPLSPSVERFRQREREILDNPKVNLPGAVRAVTDNAYDKLFKRYTAEQLERAKIVITNYHAFLPREQGDAARLPWTLRLCARSGAGVTAAAAAAGHPSWRQVGHPHATWPGSSDP